MTANFGINCWKSSTTGLWEIKLKPSQQIIRGPRTLALTFPSKKKLEQSYEYNADWLKIVTNPPSPRPLPWKRVWSFMRTNHQRMLCARFGWNWPSCLREENFLNFRHLLSLFSFNFPLEKCVILHFNKLEFISPKDALCQVWFKLALWFLRRLIDRSIDWLIDWLSGREIDWLIDWVKFYAVSAIFQPYNSGKRPKMWNGQRTNFYKK